MRAAKRQGQEGEQRLRLAARQWQDLARLQPGLEATEQGQAQLRHGASGVPTPPLPPLTRDLTVPVTGGKRPVPYNGRVGREPDDVRTFVVRLSGAGAEVRGVVERVRTGRKAPVRGFEDIGRVIATMVSGKESAMTLKGKHALVTGGSRRSVLPLSRPAKGGPV